MATITMRNTTSSTTTAADDTFLLVTSIANRLAYDGSGGQGSLRRIHDC